MTRPAGFCIANDIADRVLRQRIAATSLRITKQFEESGRTRRRPLFPKQNRPIGANSQWDDSPQAACGYMNLDNRSRLIKLSARVSHRKAIASRWVSDIPNAPSGHPAGKSQPLALSHGPRAPSAAGLLPGTRRCAPRPGHIGRQAEQGGLASAVDRETQAKARSVVRPRGSSCESKGLAPADRREHAARPRPHLSKRPRKRP